MHIDLHIEHTHTTVSALPLNEKEDQNEKHSKENSPFYFCFILLPVVCAVIKG